MDYVPFDATDEEAETWTVLRDGVPRSMRSDLTNWIVARIGEMDRVRAERFHELENALDVEFPLDPTFTGLASPELSRRLLGTLTERQLLHVVDYVLIQQGSGGYRPHSASAEAILRRGRSRFTVAKHDDCDRLGYRVPEGVRRAAEHVMTVESVASRLLRRAWTKIHDLEPDDGGAYWNAVKAVEAAALPALDIVGDSATLSHAVRAIEKRDATWRLPFVREHTEYPSRDVLLGMLKSLYRGQRDRHGSEAYADVTHEEAEAAVLMAVTLVGWFGGRLVRERDVETYG